MTALITSKPLSLIAALGASLALIACGNDDNGDTTNTGGTTTSGTEVSTDNNAAAGTDVGNPNSPGTQAMILGDPDAPVLLVEYASVTCGACAAFHVNAYPELKEKYIDTGKVKLEYREFPTAPAQLSYLGSALARCAADSKGSQAYFAMVGTLFNNQQKWVNQTNFQSEILSYAAQAGLSEEAFRACVGRDEIIGAINDNVRIGRDEYGVDSTPTFLVDGDELSGYRTYADFFDMLDEKLVEAGVEPPADAPAQDSAVEQEAVTPTEGAAPSETPAEAPAETPSDEETE
ncbi:DsbA family protein [Parvularcula flava]|uniref:DsbA family protein n=1 Tax=Aquisalinus luteolus TaxID=1566827 RepID=A0A8J3A322_9PROT|nr:DsbA family protein [Aquisalinus luteolus]NHK28728.1 DsbA family protein [Aquisalinus luteolus]GGH99341.1 hypothetical protein GCM10011355_25070 [Aquisalinus luteolus]